MKKLQLIISLILLLIMLSDPDSGCYGCDSSISRNGFLPDTTLKLNDTWKIDIKNELWEERVYCEYESDPRAPKIDTYQSQSLLEISQKDSSLFIKAIKNGKLTLTLIAATEGGVDPEIVSQTIQVTVIE